MKRSISRLAALGFALALALPSGAGPAQAFDKIFAPATAGSAVRIDHSAWDRLLKTYVTTDPEGVNRVAYGRLKAEARGELKAYIASLEKTDVGKLDRREQFAFWANLYNARTVDIVVQHYPVGSIKDIKLGGSLIGLVKGGPWSAKVVKVAGHDLSLDDIEHGIMRPLFKDPRIHYAVNCAAVSCPNLQKEAFVGARLESQLDAAARAFINSPRGVQVANGKIQLSSIYNWYQSDFGGDAQGVLAHVKPYAAPQLEGPLSNASGNIDYAYDWRLNDAK